MGKRSFWLGIILSLITFVLPACNPPDLVVGCDVGELIQAIHSANSNPDPSTILLDESCLYTLTVQDNQIDWQEENTGESGFTGLPPITTEITIKGQQATIHRLSSTPEMRFFFVTSTGKLTLEEVTLSNGLVQSGQYGYKNGGAIYNRGVLHLVRSHVLDSEAADSAGAIFNEVGATLHVENSSVSFNTAGKQGGAITNGGILVIDGFSIINENRAGGTGGAIMNSGELDIIGSHVSYNQSLVRGGAISTGLQASNLFDQVLFEGNQTAGTGGGAVYFDNTIFSITDCTFHQNQTTTSIGSGGAIFVVDSTGTIGDDTVFSENVSARSGGGLYLIGASVVDIDLTRFINNFAVQGGGGLANYVQGMDVTISNSTFDGNSALYGGGITNGGRLNVQTSTISGNTSSEGGAGIYNNGMMFKLTNATVSGNVNNNVGGGVLNYGKIKISFSTIAFNQSMHGAGVYDNGQEVQVKNSIISNNSPHNCSVVGPMVALGDNLDDDGSCQGFNLTADSSLAALADNGGATMTHGFIFASPAVDGSTDCTNIAGSIPIIEDQRGEPRPVNTQCDLGAFEAQSTPLFFLAFIDVNMQLLECLAGPGDSFDLIASYHSGDRLTTLGRNADGSWLGIAGMNGQSSEVACWVPSAGVDSLEPVMNFPRLVEPIYHPPEPGAEGVDIEEEEVGYNRCALFQPETYSLTLLDIPAGTGDLTLYVSMPEGVYGLEVEVPEDLEPWIYSAVLGDRTNEMCTYDGYAGRLYCRLDIPETYFGTVRTFSLHVNGCSEAIYIHDLVTIPEPPEPIVCSSGLDEDTCISAGGSYSCGASAACECVCP